MADLVMPSDGLVVHAPAGALPNLSGYDQGGPPDAGARVPWGTWEPNGTWQHNPELSLSAAAQRAQNEANGYACHGADRVTLLHVAGNSADAAWMESLAPEEVKAALCVLASDKPQQENDRG